MLNERQDEDKEVKCQTFLRATRAGICGESWSFTSWRNKRLSNWISGNIRDNATSSFRYLVLWLKNHSICWLPRGHIKCWAFWPSKKRRNFLMEAIWWKAAILEPPCLKSNRLKKITFCQRKKFYGVQNIQPVIPNF